jgi:hypothetical protein
MKQALFGLLAAGVLAGAAAPAHADRLADTCKAYTQVPANASSEMRAYFAHSKGAALIVCTSRGGAPERFIALLPAWTGRLGTCYSWEVDVFPNRSPGGEISWSGRPTDKSVVNSGRSYPIAQLYMAEPDGKCPPSGDDRYVAVGGVSEGVFQAIMRTWRRLSLDDKNFNAVFASLPASQRQTTDFGEFAAAMRKRAVSHTVPIDSIFLREPIVGSTDPSRYSIRIEDPGDRSRSYHLDIDLTENGFTASKFEVDTN